MRFWTNVSVRGDKALVREVVDGKRVKREVKYSPVVYVPCAEEKATHRTLMDGPCAEYELDSISSAKSFLRENPGICHGYDRWGYQMIAREYPGKVEYDSSAILVGYLDIEVMADDGFSTPDEASSEVTLVTIKVGERIVMFGCQPYEPSDPRVEFNLCSDESELLRRFVEEWSRPETCPDILTGWNIEGYDVPYLVNRITKVLGAEYAKRLSPWRTLGERRVFSMGQERTVYLPMGVSILDYQRLFHKLGVMTRACETPDDYKLNTVAHQEIGETKLDYSEYEGIHDLYLRSWPTYCDYNIKDVLLVESLERKLRLIELVMMMAYDCKVNFEDMLGSVRPWECKIHHELLSEGIVLPPRRQSGDQDLIGAFVKDPDPSGYDWVVSFDVDGMYPAIISMMNISPETKAGVLPERFEYDDEFPLAIGAYTDWLVENRVVVAANSQLFRADVKGHVPRILESVAEKRNHAKSMYNQVSKEYERTKDPALKDQMSRWKNEDKGLKVLRNACYGVLTNKHFIFYDHSMAEAITASGQVIIKWVTRRINEFMNRTLRTDGVDYAIANDTDSSYINMGPIVDLVMGGRTPGEVCDFLDKLCSTKMQEVIDGSFVELQSAINAPVNFLSMKREAIASRGIWTGKKHYVLNMLDKEGVRFSEPKIEIKGMAAVKSSTPPACRERIKQAIKIIMGGTESDVERFISDFRREFDTLPFHEIAFPRGVNDIDKWRDSVSLCRPGTPIQVRAALNYNRLIETRGLRSFPAIFDGDKIKFAYMMTPNPITDNVFGTPGPLVPGVEDYIDRDQMFSKGFLTPLRSILDAIGWRSAQSEGQTLDSYFG